MKDLKPLSPVELASLVRAKVIPRRLALRELAEQGYKLPRPPSEDDRFAKDHNVFTLQMTFTDETTPEDVAQFAATAFRNHVRKLNDGLHNASEA